jgi:hypothetical protein
MVCLAELDTPYNFSVERVSRVGARLTKKGPQY